MDPKTMFLEGPGAPANLEILEIQDFGDPESSDFCSAIFDVVCKHFAKNCAFRLGFLNISGFPTQVASGGFFPEKQQPPKFGHAGLVKFGQFLVIFCPKMIKNVPGPHFSW